MLHAAEHTANIPYYYFWSQLLLRRLLQGTKEGPPSSAMLRLGVAPAAAPRAAALAGGLPPFAGNVAGLPAQQWKLLALQAAGALLALR